MQVRGYDSEQARYERWSKMCEDPTICNSNAYSAIVWGYDDVDPHIDSLCHQDLAANGHCWCGKLTAESAQSDEFAQFDGRDDASES